MNEKLSDEMLFGVSFFSDDGLGEFGKSYLFAAVRFIVAGGIVYAIGGYLDLPKTTVSQWQNGHWEKWELLYLVPIGYGLLRLGLVLLMFCVPLLMSMPYWLVTKFLLYSPKGVVFAVGFVLLIASFICRYLKLPAG